MARNPGSGTPSKPNPLQNLNTSPRLGAARVGPGQLSNQGPQSGTVGSGVRIIPSSNARPYEPGSSSFVGGKRPRNAKPAGQGGDNPKPSGGA